jgi:hypothetical protein
MSPSAVWWSRRRDRQIITPPVASSTDPTMATTKDPVPVPVEGKRPDRGATSGGPSEAPGAGGPGTTPGCGVTATGGASAEAACSAGSVQSMSPPPVGVHGRRVPAPEATGVSGAGMVAFGRDYRETKNTVGSN